MKRLLLVLTLLLLPSLAWGQCNGVFAPQTACGTVAGGIPGQIPFNTFGGPTGATGSLQTNNGSGGFGNIPFPGGTATFLRADGTYAAPVAVGASGSASQLRLTLTTGVPITSTDVAGATAHFVTPFIGNVVPIYNGSVFTPTTFTEVTQATTDTTKSPAAVAANKVYDIFCWTDTGPTNRCTRGPAWASDTSRGTGAGTSEITLLQGIYVNANAITNGPVANFGTLVGSVRSNASSQLMDTAAFRWTSNAYNCVLRSLAVIDSTATWAYTTATFRQANSGGGANGNQLDFLQTLAGGQLNATAQQTYSNSSAGQYGIPGIDIDTVNTIARVNNLVTLSQTTTASLTIPSLAIYNGLPGLGRHIAIWVEYSSASGAGTFYGNAGAALFQSGIYGSICN